MKNLKEYGYGHSVKRNWYAGRSSEKGLIEKHST